MRSANRSVDGVAGRSVLLDARSAVMDAFMNGRYEVVLGTFVSKSKSARRAFVRFAASTYSKRTGSGPAPNRRSPTVPRGERGARRVHGGKPTTSFPSLTVVVNAGSRTTDCSAAHATCRSHSRGARNEARSQSPKASSQSSTPAATRQAPSAKDYTPTINERAKRASASIH